MKQLYSPPKGPPPRYSLPVEDYPDNHLPQANPNHENHQQQVPLNSSSSTASVPLASSSISNSKLSPNADGPPDYGDVPPADLALTTGYTSAPLIHVAGGSRHPDLQVTLSDGHPLYALETESTMVYHETHVRSALPTPSSLFNIRRHPIPDQPDGHWRYTIHSHTPGGHGPTKILEMDTDPRMLEGECWNTRMIFRNAFTGELDGLTLVTTQEGLNGKGPGAEILYKGQKVADILDQGKHDPGYDARIYRKGLDPFLVVVGIYAIDDRNMSVKRRNRRSRLAGLPGVGRGRGAGLAGAYAVAGV
ncbi:hypothetical protein PMZ80_004155 [Knufia obscura]|uniref:Uncharacterized protein n=1 Tax=Knufia obscura TaxID=1635080 RepID=A0ABR0RSW8_9EURO|nr:hypothetical protein PMZ80_004155 [Knufia obscura]